MREPLQQRVMAPKLISETRIQLLIILPCIFPSSLLATNSTVEISVSEIIPSPTPAVNPSQTTDFNTLVTEMPFNSSVTEFHQPLSTYNSLLTTPSSAQVSFHLEPTTVKRTSSTTNQVLPSPTDKPDSNGLSLPLSLEAIIGIAVGGTILFLAIITCLFCCWYYCFHAKRNYDYRTGAATEFKITAQYWVQGSAQYSVKRSASISSSWSRGSSLSRSRMSSIRSALGLRASGVKRGAGENEMYENQGNKVFSTPL